MNEGNIGFPYEKWKLYNVTYVKTILNRFIFYNIDNINKRNYTKNKCGVEIWMSMFGHYNPKISRIGKRHLNAGYSSIVKRLCPFNIVVL